MICPSGIGLYFIIIVGLWLIEDTGLIHLFMSIFSQNCLIPYLGEVHGE